MVPGRYRLLPILRALDFFDFRIHPSGIEQLLQLNPGDVQLVLRNLHSVLLVPEPGSDNVQSIRVHHASFRDFLKDQTRSGEFYVGGLQHRVELGKCVLKALSYTYENASINRAGPVAFARSLQDATKKIPPLPEMIPLIRLINPDFSFFHLDSLLTGQILSLLANIGNPPHDLIQLWGAYRFMGEVQDSMHGPQFPAFQTYNDNDDSPLMDCEPLYQCTLLPRILQAFILGEGWAEHQHLSLLNIHVLLDISWEDLRVSICRLQIQHHILDNETAGKVLRFVAEHLSPEPAMMQLLLDLACGCIRLLTGQQLLWWHLSVPWGCFIRASPHSMGLLQNIRGVHFDTSDDTAF
ncbi:hypothetical protein C8J57DRAFT_1190709, partial [Mycena rebaudengoi]